jgi:hypothetical protein
MSCRNNGDLIICCQCHCPSSAPVTATHCEVCGHIYCNEKCCEISDHPLPATHCSHTEEEPREFCYNARDCNSNNPTTSLPYVLTNWWICCLNGHPNNPNLSPELCSQCPHKRCSRCPSYEGDPIGYQSIPWPLTE